KYNSVTFKNVKQHTHNRIKIEKLGSVKYFKSRDIKGKIQRATIIRKNNNYYISITAKQETTPVEINKNSVVGIDLGITKLATLSDGNFYDNIKTLEKYQSKLRIEQRSLSRKKKGSNS